MARQGKARQGKARQGKARQGKARQGKARQDMAKQKTKREETSKSGGKGRTITRGTATIFLPGHGAHTSVSPPQSRKPTDTDINRYVCHTPSVGTHTVGRVLDHSSRSGVGPQ